MGLTISVYRDSKIDCTNGGISSNHDRLTVINIDGPFKATKDSPAVLLKQGAYESNAILVPVLADDHEDERTIGEMFGGNYGATSDSRFNRAVELITGIPCWHGAVPIHDRYETPQDYAALTRD